MTTNLWIKASITGLFLSSSSLALAKAPHFTRPLPQCGGVAILEVQETSLLLKLKDVKNCSIVSAGTKSIKMTKSQYGYSLSYEIPFMNTPSEVLVHSNSRKTMDRIPMDDRVHSSPSAQASQSQTPPLMMESKIKLMDLCHDAFDGSSQESRCVQIAMNRRLDLTMIQACEEAFDGDQNEMSCLEVAPSPEIISSCEQVFDGDDNELKCLATARSVGTIQACDDTFDGDQNELQCLRYSANAGFDVTEIIKKCEEQKNGDTDELECIRMMLGS